jgi:hypothetical protein
MMNATKKPVSTEGSSKRKIEDSKIDEESLFFTKKPKTSDEAEGDLKKFTQDLVASVFNHNNVTYHTELLRLIESQPEFIIENLHHNIQCVDLGGRMPVISVLGSPGTGKSKIITHLGHFCNCPIQPSAENSTGVHVFHSKVFEDTFPVTTFLEVEGTDGLFESNAMKEERLEVGMYTNNKTDPIEIGSSESDETSNSSSCDEEDIDPRDVAIREYFPTLCVLISDVVILVTDTKSEESDFSLLREACGTLSTNMKLAKNKPMLIIVYNKQPLTDENNVKKQTSEFLKVHDPNGIIQEVFANIQCTTLPNVLGNDQSGLTGKRWEYNISAIRSFIYEQISVNDRKLTPKSWYISLPSTLKRVIFPFECILSHLKMLFQSLFPSGSKSFELYLAARKYTFLALSRCFVAYLLHHGGDVSRSVNKWKPQLKLFCEMLWDALKSEQPCSHTRDKDTCKYRYGNHPDSHSYSSSNPWTFFKDLVSRSLIGDFQEPLVIDYSEATLEAMTQLVFSSIQDYSQKNVSEVHILAETLLSVCSRIPTGMKCDYHLCPSPNHSCHRCWRLNNATRDHVWDSERVLDFESSGLNLPSETKLYYCQSCYNEQNSGTNNQSVEHQDIGLNFNRNDKFVLEEEELIPI